MYVSLANVKGRPPTHHLDLDILNLIFKSNSTFCWVLSMKKRFRMGMLRLSFNPYAAAGYFGQHKIMPKT